MKTVNLVNQHDDYPSLRVSGGELVLHGTISNGDRIRCRSVTDLLVLQAWITKELDRAPAGDAETFRPLQIDDQGNVIPNCTADLGESFDCEWLVREIQRGAR